MNKTYGTLIYNEPAREWIITAEPDVAMRLKRILPRTQQTVLRQLVVAHTADVARDLEWILDRWPMDIDDISADVLHQGAAQHRARVEYVNSILSGSAAHADLPLQPADAMTPRPYQQTAYDLLRATGGLLLADELGLGKAQPLDSAVLTPAGFVPMGSLAVGDQVVAQDGTATAVTGVYPQDPLECFEVVFSDGAVARCSADHLWTVRHARGPTRSADGTRCYPYWKTVTLRTLIDEGLTRTGGQAKWHIPVVQPVVGVPTRLPLDPYLLGALLGDGYMVEGTVTFSSADTEMVDHVRNALPPGVKIEPILNSKFDYRLNNTYTSPECAEDECKRTSTSNGLCGMHFQRRWTNGTLPQSGFKGLNPLVTALADLGLRGHLSHTKFIPDLYLTAGPDDRLALLQGLMDADGYAMPLRHSATAQFYSSSAKLADGVVYLAQSLGGTARLTTKFFKGRDRYTVTVKLPQPLNPFRLARKATVWGDGHQTLKPTRAIKSVRSLGFSVPMQCISVAHESRQYVTDSFVVTHNTLVGTLPLSDPALRPMLVVTLTGLPRQWLRELGKTFPDLIGHEVTKTKPYDLTDANGRTPDMIVMNYAKLAGWADHLAGRVNSVVFDEVQELRHDGTQKHVAAAMVAADAHTVIGLSATPVYNFGGEMYSIMSILRPGLLGSKTEFGREWCKSTNGVDSKTRIADPAAFRAFLFDNGAMLRRTRADVGVSLPPIVPVEQYVNADEKALDAAAGNAAEIARLILAADTNHRDRWTAAGDMDWRLRQATGIAKAPFVAEFVRLILESEEKIVLLGWHRSVWDLWMDRLAAFRPALYTGTESVTQKGAAFDRFVDDPTCRVLMLSLRSGAGLDGLQAVASTLVFGELDWSPGVHKQAIGRLLRPGQTKPGKAYFCVSEHGSDPVIAERLNVKKLEADLLVSPEDATDTEPVEVVNHGVLLARAVLAKHEAAASRQRAA